MNLAPCWLTCAVVAEGCRLLLVPHYVRYLDLSFVVVLTVQHGETSEGVVRLWASRVVSERTLDPLQPCPSAPV